MPWAFESCKKLEAQFQNGVQWPKTLLTIRHGATQKALNQAEEAAVV